MVDWTRDAAPGDELVWGDVAGSYAPPEDTDWRLLAGDITALPAIGRIVEELPAGARAVVVAETYDPADRQEWETEGDVDVVWLHGSGEGRAPSIVGAAVLEFPEPDGAGYRWLAGETRVVRAVRRNMRHERALPKAQWSLTGYWLERGEEWRPATTRSRRRWSASGCAARPRAATRRTSWTSTSGRWRRRGCSPGPR